MSEEGPFYLDLLLFCHVPMLGYVRRGRRGYICLKCRRLIDALAAEVEVWELATRERPELGDGTTPYARRGALLAAALRRVRYRPGTQFLLQWCEPAGRSA